MKFYVIPNLSEAMGKPSGVNWGRVKVGPIVQQIVGRQHVGTPHKDVLRYVISRMKDGKKQWRSQPYRSRRALLKQVIAAHKRNQAEYKWVMGGMHGKMGTQ